MPHVGRAQGVAGVFGTAVIAVAAAASPAVAAAGGHGSSSGHNPPGNNGTVKIHAAPGESTHANQPHVPCTFYVDLWGFDAGQHLGLSFTGQAPTGAGRSVSFTQIAGSNPMVSPDDAGGGRDFDGEAGFRAEPAQLSTLGAPAKQGYHVRLTVSTGQGGGTKTKVFWIEPCAASGSAGGSASGGSSTGTGAGSSTGSSTGSSSSTTTSGQTSHTTGGGVTSPASGGSTTSTSAGTSETSAAGSSLSPANGGGTASSVAGASAGGSTAGADVLGQRFARPAASTGRLAFTGLEVTSLVTLAGIALAAGVALLVVSRRRKLGSSAL